MSLTKTTLLARRSKTRRGRAKTGGRNQASREDGKSRVSPSKGPRHQEGKDAGNQAERDGPARAPQGLNNTPHNEGKSDGIEDASRTTDRGLGHVEDSSMSSARRGQPSPRTKPDVSEGTRNGFESLVSSIQSRLELVDVETAGVRQDLAGLKSKHSIVRDRVRSNRHDLQESKKREEDLRQKCRLQNEDLEQSRVDLARVRGQVASSSKELSKLKVMLGSETQRAGEAEADRDLYKAMHDEHLSRQILGSGLNIQANFPTLSELVADTRRATTVSVSGWIDKIEMMLSPSPEERLDVLTCILQELYKSCERAVSKRLRVIAAVVLGKVEDTVQDEDDFAGDDMIDHLRRHHTNLFPLTGDQGQVQVTNIISTVARNLHHPRLRILLRTPDEAVRLFATTGMGKIVEEYCRILIGRALQKPPVFFSGDCGEVQPFDPDAHNPPIDGGDRPHSCAVVFPALLIACDKNAGFEVVSKRYVLGRPLTCPATGSITAEQKGVAASDGAIIARSKCEDAVEVSRVTCTITSCQQ